MKLSMQPVELDRFTSEKKADGWELVAEMSDFGPLRSNFLHRIWDDACDVGMAVRSHVTGQIHEFVLSHEEFIGQGEDKELGYLVLTPLDASCPVTKVTIFND